jgi:hypothetical protein
MSIDRLAVPPIFRELVRSYDVAALAFAREIDRFPTSTPATIGAALEELDDAGAPIVAYLAESEGLEVPGRIEVLVQKAIDAGSDLDRKDAEEADVVRAIRIAAHAAWLHFCPWRAS